MLQLDRQRLRATAQSPARGSRRGINAPEWARRKSRRWRLQTTPSLHAMKEHKQGRARRELPLIMEPSAAKDNTSWRSKRAIVRAQTKRTSSRHLTSPTHRLLCSSRHASVHCCTFCPKGTHTHLQLRRKKKPRTAAEARRSLPTSRRLDYLANGLQAGRTLSQDHGFRRRRGEKEPLAAQKPTPDEPSLSFALSSNHQSPVEQGTKGKASALGIATTPLALSSSEHGYLGDTASLLEATWMIAGQATQLMEEVRESRPSFFCVGKIIFTPSDR